MNGTTLTLFIVFVLLVIFVGKRGSGFWSTLFSHNDYPTNGPGGFISGLNPVNLVTGAFKPFGSNANAA